MKIILCAIGTRGDVEPFLAIAEKLKAKGSETVCMFPEQFRELTESEGHKFYGFDKRFIELIEGPNGRLIMGGSGGVLKRIKALIDLSKASMKLQKQMLTLQHDVIQNENPDKVIYHQKCIFPLVWGVENIGKSIMVSPMPCILHEVEGASAIMFRENKDYGNFLNKLSYWFVNSIRARVFFKTTKKYHNEITNKKFSISYLKNHLLTKETTYYSFSEALFPQPEYWPNSAKVIGYYERNKTKEWIADSSLSNFIDNNKKIVFITFGSMSNSDPKEKTKTIINVLAKHKIAAIINTSWGGLLKPDTYPDHIHFVSDIPYEWVFPRVYAVIHHGGAGTSHTAIKHGCASLIVPHIVDQYFWNNLFSSLKLGPKGVPINKLNENNFEQKLLELINNDEYKQNAIKKSSEMEAENIDEKYIDEILK